MDRRERLKEVAAQEEERLFLSQCRKLEQEYRGGEYRDMALGAFVQLLELASRQEKVAAWLGICVLDTSLVSETHEVLLALYDQDFYFDPVPIELYWKPLGFKECFEEDMETIMKRLHLQFPRLWEYEETVVHQTCMEYYHAAFCQLCQDLRDEIIGTNAFQNMKKAKRFNAFFGQYHGEGEILWHI